VYKPVRGIGVLDGVEIVKRIEGAVLEVNARHPLDYLREGRRRGSSQMTLVFLMW